MRLDLVATQIPSCDWIGKMQGTTDVATKNQGRDIGRAEGTKYKS